MKKLLLSVLIFSSFAIYGDEERRPVRVYVDMVGDLFHYGHVEFFQKALEFGDELVVGLVSDEDAASYKRIPYMTLEERTLSVQACPYVDEVFPDCPLVVSKEWLLEHDIDIVVHGDDFDDDTIWTYYKTPILMGIFRTVPYTKGISTSEIIRRIQERM